MTGTVNHGIDATAPGVMSLGVVVIRRRLRGPWADHAWAAHGLLPQVPAALPGSALGAAGEDALFYAGSSELTLHPSATANYRANLASGQPSIWVSLRPAGSGGPKVASLTADPYEGEAMAEGIGPLIEALPMPREIQERVAAFCERFHREQPFIKRKRDRADPDALGHRRRGGAR